MFALKVVRTQKTAADFPFTRETRPAAVAGYHPRRTIRIITLHSAALRRGGAPHTRIL